MCAVAGFVAGDPRRAAPTEWRHDVAVMLAAMAHRGPDGAGIQDCGPAVLGHRRLAVIDTSPRGAQPMSLRCSPPGEPRAWIVYNGEIYNYVELREELSRAGHRFHSDTDTEVILHLYEDIGADCVTRLRGMFALALWDVPARRLLLARDRMGEKPLYYRLGPEGLAFASEIKAFVALARARGDSVEPRAAALRSYLALKYVPGPGTALEGIFKLPPANVMIYEEGHASIRPYWVLPEAAPDGAARDPEMIEQLKAAITESVAMRMRSDVPLGLFLSGGLDSGIIAACMAGAAASSRTPARVETFTVGFAEKDYDELRAAALVARTLGTNHHEIHVSPTPRDTADALPGLAWQLDQPFADSSALAVYHLAREVRRHVTVALSGDGGDELFLGYDRYRAHRLAQRISRVPGAAGAVAAGLVSAVLPAPPGRRNLSGRARRFMAAVGLSPAERNDAWVTCIGEDLAARLLTSDFLGSDGGVKDAPDPLAALHESYGRPSQPDSATSTADTLQSFQRADLLVFLPDDILHKVDAATMAHSLESRVPFLDHHVVELAMRIPPAAKLSRGRGKAILRDAFAADLPSAIIAGRKAGFGLPLDHWLRGDLSGYCRDLLLDGRSLSRGLLRREGVVSLLEEHTTGRANREDAIWGLVMMELWLRTVMEGATATVEAGP